MLHLSPHTADHSRRERTDAADTDGERDTEHRDTEAEMCITERERERGT